jgi:hypothetical protein
MSQDAAYLAHIGEILKEILNELRDINKTIRETAAKQNHAPAHR